MFSSRYRSSRNLVGMSEYSDLEYPDIRAIHYFLRKRWKKLCEGRVSTLAFSRLSRHMIVQDVVWASALMSRARWFATSSGRPHATIVSARWVPYDAFRLHAPHLFKAAARSFEKDNAVRPPTIAVSFTQIRIGTVPSSRSIQPSSRPGCVFH